MNNLVNYLSHKNKIIVVDVGASYGRTFNLLNQLMQQSFNNLWNRLLPQFGQL